MIGEKMKLMQWWISILLLNFYSCSIQNENRFGLHYDEDNRKMFFHIRNLNKEDLEMNIYWEDSLLCSPYIDYDKGLDSCFVDIFPNSLIGGYYAKPYLLDICYSYSEKGFLPLRYVLVNRKSDTAIFDTVLYVSNLVEDGIKKRFNMSRRISYPIVDLKNSGFNHLRHTDYFSFAKGTLYMKGLRNLDEQILVRTANLVDAFLNQGYQMFFVPQTDSYLGKIANSLSVHVPDSISKVYLLLASLSGKEDAKDFSFEIGQEVADFIGQEYTLGFKNSVINNRKYIKVPIKKVGYHKYNFVQILLAVYILENNDYQCIPIGYIFTRNPQEMQNFIAEGNVVKYIVSPINRYYIDELFMINYYGRATLF